MNKQAQLIFQRSRLRLAILYASVIGGILLSLGFVAHMVMHEAFERVVDRELDLLSKAVNSKIINVLQEPGMLSDDTKRIFPEICFLEQPCPAAHQASSLNDLIHNGYYIQILKLNGAVVASISETKTQFPTNLQLVDSQTIYIRNGEAFHLHLLPLKAANGKQWGYLRVGRSIQKMDDYMRDLQWLLMIGVPVSTALIGGVGWLLAGLAMRPIYQSYEQMQKFMADVAHELKTPLATTQAIIETAFTDNSLVNSSGNYAQLLQALDRQNQRLNQLVQDLLLLTRLDTRSMIFSMDQSICLNELVRDLEEELAPLAIAAKVDLSYQIQTQEALEISGNINQLYRMVSNLVSNGISYTSAGGKVIIRLQQTGQEAVIQVEDNGIGIAAADVTHLFERFYRVNADRSRSTGGSGLGLSIVQAIVQAHGGDVTVASQIGTGSTFSVHLPLSARNANR
jgi:signal transduction histidine kinase